MDPKPIPEDTRITVATTLSLWAGTVAAAAASGVFAKFSIEELATLAIFATVFAVATYALDPEVREYARAIPVARIALVLDAIVAIDAVYLLRAADWESIVSTLPHAVVVLFVLPLAAAISAAALNQREKRALKSPRAKSPGATRVAT